MADSHPHPNQHHNTPIDEIWRSVSDQVKSQMGRADFDAYLREAQALYLQDDLFYVSAPSQMARDWLSSRLTSTINRQLAPLVGRPVQVRFVFPAPEGAVQGQKAQKRAENTPEKLAYFSPSEPLISVNEGTLKESCKGPFWGGEDKRPFSYSFITDEIEESANRAGDQGESPTRPDETAPMARANVVASSFELENDRAGNDPQPVRGAEGAQANRGASTPGQIAMTTGGGGAGEALNTGQPNSPAHSGGVTSSFSARLGASNAGRGAVVDDTASADDSAARSGTRMDTALSACAATGDDSTDDSADDCQTILIEEIADTVEAALTQPGRIVAFPRYELRHIPLVGPEAFFLRLAFLQERYLRAPAGGRGQAFETSVEALLRWANVGRATLHRFKKGDPTRGTQPAAGWFGIEQLPSAPRTGTAQQQPPCRYRLQQGIPLTPMDADRLHHLLTEAGIQADPLGALNNLLERPVQELLQFPPPAPSDEQRQRAPGFLSVAGVVQAALGGQKLESGLRARVQEAAAKLSDHITMPGQMVHVSWYFLRHWVPILGHDAAALVLYTRAQGYYNPQDQELRDEIFIPGGYAELAQVSGLKRHRTIADWLPNIFERQDGAAAASATTTSSPGAAIHPAAGPRRPKLSDPEQEPAGPKDEKWQREQQRMARAQARIGQFIQVLPGSRKKMPEGHYAFTLHVEIKAEPLTPADQGLARWVHHTLAACAEREVLAHFHAWVTSPVIAQLAGAAGQGGEGAAVAGSLAEGGDAQPACSLSAQNDGAGTLGGLNLAARVGWGAETGSNQNDGRGTLGSSGQAVALPLVAHNDGWGILAAAQMTGGESADLDDDGWGILEEILNDGAGIIPRFEMTAGELFKRLLRLHTYWESILIKLNTTAPGAQAGQPPNVVGKSWDLRSICQRNGGINRFRESILARERSAEAFLSWVYYAYSFKGRGVSDPVGWAFARLKEQPGGHAGGVFDRLAALPPARAAQLLRAHVESGMPPANEDWKYAFRDVQVTKLREMAETLGLAG